MCVKQQYVQHHWRQDKDSSCQAKTEPPTSILRAVRDPAATPRHNPLAAIISLYTLLPPMRGCSKFTLGINRSSIAVAAAILCPRTASAVAVPGVCAGIRSLAYRRFTMATSATPTAADVLAFWFGPDYEKPGAIAFDIKWFMSTPEFDSAIAQKFGPLIDRVVAEGDGELAKWEGDATGLLAKILVADQFTRNTRRGTPAAFAGDHVAGRLALRFCEHPDFDSLPDMMKWFGLMPMMHSENLELQKVRVKITLSTISRHWLIFFLPALHC